MPQKVYLDDSGNPLSAQRSAGPKVYLDDAGEPVKRTMTPQTETQFEKENSLQGQLARARNPLNALSEVRRQMDVAAQDWNETADKAANRPEIFNRFGDFSARSLSTIMRLGSGMTQPKSLLTTAAAVAAPEITLPVLAVMGANEARTGKQPGETDADALERRLLGASQVAGAGAGTAGVLSGKVTPTTPRLYRLLKEGATSPNVMPKVKALGKVAAEEAISHIPVAGRLVRRPSALDYVKAARAKAPAAKPVIDATEPVTPPASPDPAPYRMSGSQIQDAVTVTPRAPFLPKGLLKAGPTEAIVTQTEPVMTSLKGKTPAAQQAEVFKKMGVAAPKASVAPMAEIPEGTLTPRTDMTFPGVKNGESAALHQLSDYSINELRAIAVQRGIAIKAADTHGVLIKRIGDTLTEPEINEFAQAAAESQRFQKLPWKRQITTKSQPQVPTSDSQLAKLLKQSVKEVSAQKRSGRNGTQPTRPRRRAQRTEE